jgi:hypothetical protein
MAEADRPAYRRQAALLPQNKMLPEGIVGEGAFGKRVEDSIKFILHGLS